MNLSSDICACFRVDELTDSYHAIIDDKSTRTSIADTATCFGDNLVDTLAIMFGEYNDSSIWCFTKAPRSANLSASCFTRSELKMCLHLQTSI